MSFLTELPTAQKFISFLEWAIRNPTDQAALKIAGDILVIAKDVFSDPRVSQTEADIDAYIALQPKVAEAPAPAPVDPPSSQQPTDDRADHAHGSLMSPGI